MNDDQEARNGRLIIRVTNVLNMIEKCMRSFKAFTEVEENKPWWKESRHFSWSRSPSRRPMRLQLLACSHTYTLSGDKFSNSWMIKKNNFVEFEFIFASIVPFTERVMDERFKRKEEMLAQKKSKNH